MTAEKKINDFDIFGTKTVSVYLNKYREVFVEFV